MAVGGRAAYGALMYRLAVVLRREQSVYQRLDGLRQIEFLPSETVLRQQRIALADMLRDKLVRIPYYRPWRHLAATLSEDNVTDVLRELPIVEKEVVQSQRGQLRVDAWRGRSYTKTTGGSTGRPVTVEKDAEAIAQEMAATWLGYGWFGVEIGDPCVRFWGQPASNIRRRARYIAADAATNRITLSAFGYSPSTLDDYVRRIRRFRPAFLYGYVSALEDLARHIVRRGEPLDDLAIKCVVTTSEVLSDPQRALIAQAFNAPVQNEYGCGEVGPIAYECPAGSLHLLPTNHYVELIGPSGAPVAHGQPGSVVITDLVNDVMPLIRYRVGDTAAAGDSCTCGRSFPVLSSVFGREYDFIESPSGERFHGEFFMYLFEDLRQKYPAIGQFKVIQLTIDRLLVQVVLSGTAPSDLKAMLVTELHRRLPHFHADIEYVDSIERQASGKMRVVENRTGIRDHQAVPPQ